MKKESVRFSIDFSPFLGPQIVTRPMDLGAVRRKLYSYDNAAQFAADVRLIWTNCLAFNDARSWGLHLRCYLVSSLISYLFFLSFSLSLALS